jgi:hypothetical protein
MGSHDKFWAGKKKHMLILMTNDSLIALSSKLLWLMRKLEKKVDFRYWYLNRSWYVTDVKYDAPLKNSLP